MKIQFAKFLEKYTNASNLQNISPTIYTRYTALVIGCLRLTRKLLEI